MNGTWIQNGGQDPTMPVDATSIAWWWEQRDKRSDQYYLLMNPLLTILASLGYVLFVTWIGPWLMRDRKPFGLKGCAMWVKTGQWGAMRGNVGQCGAMWVCEILQDYAEKGPRNLQNPS